MRWARAPIRARRVALAVAVLGRSGCGYSLAGRGSFLPAYIKIIGVPQFTNNTPVFDIERQLTGAVRAELIGRGKYKVVPNRTAASDAVLTGEICTSASGRWRSTSSSRRRVYIVVVTRVEFKDLKTDKVLWSNPALQFREEYDRPEPEREHRRRRAPSSARTSTRSIASSTEFARAVVSAILEAF